MPPKATNKKQRRWNRSDQPQPTSCEVGDRNSNQGYTGAALNSLHTSQNSTMPRSGAGYIPVCSEEEALAFTVQIENIETDLLPVLEEHGCAIVAGVANEEQCRRLEALFAEDLADLIDDAAVSRAGSAVQHLAKSVAEDAKAWPEASMKLLGNIGRCQLRGLPHGRFAWECRLLNNVRRCYEIVHGRQDLVSSCDNPFFSPATQKEQQENKSWPHVDQNLHDKRFFDDAGVPVGQWDVYQGILYVWSSQGVHASTTVVLPGSQRDMYDNIMRCDSMKKKGSKGAHFSQLSYVPSGIGDQVRELWNVGARRVPVPRGGLFLWSSRTLHQGWTGGPRLAQPVCWEPRPRRHDWALDCKVRLAALGLPSTHWASLGIPHTLVTPEPCKVTEVSVSGREVCLPARASIHLASLLPEVDVKDMWRRLETLSWEELLPEDLREFLKSCLTEAVRDAL